ncbi:MAG: signal peptidase I [Opitutales bacterium]|nr:signal peptidase I [Opitutales bacterium]
MSKISRKLLKQADEQCRIAEKIFHYRCDVLGEERRSALRSTLDRVQEIKDSHDPQTPEALESAMEALDAEMKLCGGTFYPKRGLNENVEVLLVAALLAIGIRMFFVQPFRIPTNSMYPTYNGMTFEVFEDPDKTPSVLMRPIRAVTLGASRVEVIAPEDGEIVIPLARNVAVKEGYTLPGRAVKARKWFGLLPTTNAEHVLQVGGKLQPVQVPVEFQLSKVLWRRFGAPTTDKLRLGPGGVWYYHTGVQAVKGESCLSFDILLGDQLFVDRVSYHFRAPRVGEPIVFRTDSIEGMSEGERGKYYIKRLVGVGGDELRVEAPVLYRNGKPIEGAEAFELNAQKEGEYEGYLEEITNRDQAPLVEPFTVPQGQCFAMGDNSDESADSRFWGTLPQNAIVGKALVIYYPFTDHVGAAK